MLPSNNQDICKEFVGTWGSEGYCSNPVLNRESVVDFRCTRIDQLEFERLHPSLRARARVKEILKDEEQFYQSVDLKECRCPWVSPEAVKNRGMKVSRRFCPR